MPNASGEQFGKARLRDTIRECAAGSADGIARAVRDRLTAFRGDAKPVDDVTFVVIKMAPAAGATGGAAHTPPAERSATSPLNHRTS